jgi:hypothetical protein
MQAYFRDLAKRDRQGKRLLEESGKRWQTSAEENSKRQTIAAVIAKKPSQKWLNNHSLAGAYARLQV